MLELRCDDRPSLEVIEYEEHRKHGQDQRENAAHCSNHALHPSTVPQCGYRDDDEEAEQGDQQKVAELSDSPEPPPFVPEPEGHYLGSGIGEWNEHQKCTK